MSQIELLLDLMYQQLVTKKALTFRIKSLYNNVKDNYSEHILEDMDIAVQQKFSHKDSGANA